MRLLFLQASRPFYTGPSSSYDGYGRYPLRYWELLMENAAGVNTQAPPGQLVAMLGQQLKQGRAGQGMTLTAAVACQCIPCHHSYKCSKVQEACTQWPSTPMVPCCLYGVRMRCTKHSLQFNSECTDNHVCLYVSHCSGCRLHQQP